MDFDDIFWVDSLREKKDVVSFGSNTRDPRCGL